MKRISKSEMKIIARSMGWTGRPTDVYEFFKARNISMADVMAKHVELGRAIAGRTTSTHTTTGGVSAAQVAEIVDEKIAAAGGMGGVTREEVNTMIVETMIEREGQGAATMPTDEKFNEEVRKLIKREVAASEPRKIIVNEKTGERVTLKERTHPKFEKVLNLLLAGQNVLLVGPAGCGKSRLAEDIARATKRKFGTLHCTAGASESQLTGWLIPRKGMNFEFVMSEFATLYSQGNSVFLLDEIDAADPNMLLVINAALANGAMHIPQNVDAPHLKRGKNAAIIAAANTYGHGADTMYSGRNQLDAATLDRFYVVEMDYDTTLEDAMVEAIGTPEARAIGQWVVELRRKVRGAGIRRVVSTRMFQKALAVHTFVPLEELKSDLMAGWKRDELAKLAAY